MNEVRRAGLEQLAMMVEAAQGQLTTILDAERAELTALEEELAPMVDPTFTRGAMIEMD